MHVHDMPDPNDRRAIGKPGRRTTVLADSTSFGYRMAARLDYSNAVGAANLFPYVQFQHDFSGNSPQLR